jgi:predicted metal-dependent hydrolase
MDPTAAQQLLARLQADAALIAGRFGLRYRAIEAERPRVKRRYGICYADGTIRIRLRHAKSGGPLKYSSLVNTLCHELAHLRHFNHGLRFQRFYAQVLAYARDRGIYVPGSEAGEPPGGVLRRLPPPRADVAREGGPRQLPLFGGSP